MGQITDIVNKLEALLRTRKSSEEMLEHLTREVIVDIVRLAEPPPTIKGFTVETRLEVKDVHKLENLGRGRPPEAQLVIHVTIAGEEVGSMVAYSGPKSDLEDLMAGQVTLKGINERWAARRPSRK